MQLPTRAIWAFHAAAKAGSISRAAEELGVTPSAVTQQIQVLETQLGLSLMHKVGRRIVLTEAGERYFATITDEIGRITEATSEIRGYRSVTALTVRATPTLSNKWLLPRLSSFLDQHPQLEIRLDGTNEPTDFSRELVDVEIRHGDGRWPGLFVEPMGEEEFIPVCTPDYAAPGTLEPARAFALSSHSFGEIASAVEPLVYAGGSHAEGTMAARPIRPQPYGNRCRRERHGDSARKHDDDGARAVRRKTHLPRVESARGPDRNAMDRLPTRSPSSQEGSTVPGMAPNGARGGARQCGQRRCLRVLPHSTVLTIRAALSVS